MSALSRSALQRHWQHDAREESQLTGLAAHQPAARCSRAGGSEPAAAAAAAVGAAGCSHGQRRRCCSTLSHLISLLPGERHSKPRALPSSPTKIPPLHLLPGSRAMLTSYLAPVGVAALQRLGPLLGVAAARAAQCRGATTMPHAAAASRPEGVDSWYTGAGHARRAWPPPPPPPVPVTNLGCQRRLLSRRAQRSCTAVRMEERLESPATRHGEVRRTAWARTQASCRCQGCACHSAVPRGCMLSLRCCQHVPRRTPSLSRTTPASGLSTCCRSTGGCLIQCCVLGPSAASPGHSCTSRHEQALDVLTTPVLVIPPTRPA